jgi:hypothetical protein
MYAYEYEILTFRLTRPMRSSYETRGQVDSSVRATSTARDFYC